VEELSVKKEKADQWHGRDLVEKISAPPEERKIVVL